MPQLRIRSIALGLLLVCLIALPALAQDDVARLSLKTVPEAIAPGQEGALVITVQVSKGFHLNSNAPAQPELIPTRVEVDPPEGLSAAEPQFPRPHSFKAEFSDTPVEVFDGEFEIKVPLKADSDAAPGPKTIRVRFSYQACDDQMCLMPVFTEFAVGLEVKDS